MAPLSMAGLPNRWLLSHVWLIEFHNMTLDLKVKAVQSVVFDGSRSKCKKQLNLCVPFFFFAFFVFMALSDHQLNSFSQTMLDSALWYRVFFLFFITVEKGKTTTKKTITSYMTRQYQYGKIFFLYFISFFQA